MSDNFSNTLMRGVGTFTSMKGIRALQNGVVATMPLSLVGSIFLLLQSLPINGYAEFMAGIFGESWREPLVQVSGATFDLLALVAVIAIAYSYAKISKAEPLSCALLGFVNFCILIPSTVISGAGDVVSGVIPKTWAGGQGMIGAIIVGLVTGVIYVYCNDKGLRINMPDGVPMGVSNAFSALIPGFFTITLSFLVYAVLKAVTGNTLIELIYNILQIPLQNLTDSFGGIIIVAFVVSFFWWFGIHGNSLVGGIMEPILMANSLANQSVIDTGGILIAGENAKIVTNQLRTNFMTLTGSGITIGIVIAAVLFAKSKQYKQLGQLSLVPGLFNINEPVIFGLPIVMNTLLLVPFIFVPIVSVSVTYFAIWSGFMTPFAGVQVPWTTPPVISGFILAGWQGALIQILIIIISFMGYYPFFKRMDQQAYLKEQNEVVDDDEDF